MHDELFLIGRIVFSLVCLVYGVRHLTQTEGSASYAAYKKVPWPKTMVLFTGAAMVIGALAVIFGFWMDLAALGIAIFVTHGHVGHAPLLGGRGCADETDRDGAIHEERLNRGRRARYCSR